MIFCFSATGNSRYVAGALGDLLDDKIVMLPTDVNRFEITEEESIGFVFPVYSWGPPPIVEKFILSLGKLKSKYVWMVCTCGDDVGKTPEIVDKALRQLGLRLNSAFSVVMPNTYLLLPGFNLDSREVEDEKLKKSTSRIKEIVSHLLRRDECVDVVRGKFAGLKSGIVRSWFNRYSLDPGKWHYTSKCVGCGLCARKCPVGNISQKRCSSVFRPEWGDNCIGCMACYHWCPENAIQYSKCTKGKGQYHFP